MVIDQDVDWAMVLRYVCPQLFCTLNIGQVCLVEVHILEAWIASHGLDVLHQLRLQVASYVDHNHIDSAELTSSDELFREHFAKALRTARDHYIRWPLDLEAFFVHVRAEPAHALVEHHHGEDEAGGVIVNEVAGQVCRLLHQVLNFFGRFRE